MRMYLWLWLCMYFVLANASGSDMLGAGSYSLGGVSFESKAASNGPVGPAMAGVYATKCWQCTGVLDSGSFVPALKR